MADNTWLVVRVMGVVFRPVVQMSEGLSFGSVGGEACWICEMSIECVGYVFVGIQNVVIEGYGSVGVCGGREFIVKGFDGIPVSVLVVFTVPWCIHMVSPDLLFMFCDVCVYFMVEL